MFVLIILYSEFHRNCVVQCQDKRKRIRPDRPSSHSTTGGFCKASMCLIVLIIYVGGFTALNHFNCKMPDHLPCRPQELEKIRWLLLLCDWCRREALHCFDFRRSGNVTAVLQKQHSMLAYITCYMSSVLAQWCIIMWHVQFLFVAESSFYWFAMWPLGFECLWP